MYPIQSKTSPFFRMMCLLKTNKYLRLPMMRWICIRCVHLRQKTSSLYIIRSFKIKKIYIYPTYFKISIHLWRKRYICLFLSLEYKIKMIRKFSPSLIIYHLSLSKKTIDEISCLHQLTYQYPKLRKYKPVLHSFRKGLMVEFLSRNTLSDVIWILFLDGKAYHLKWGFPLSMIKESMSREGSHWPLLFWGKPSSFCESAAMGWLLTGIAATSEVNISCSIVFSCLPETVPKDGGNQNWTATDHLFLHLEESWHKHLSW